MLIKDDEAIQNNFLHSKILLLNQVNFFLVNKFSKKNVLLEIMWLIIENINHMITIEKAFTAQKTSGNKSNEVESDVGKTLSIE